MLGASGPDREENRPTGPPVTGVIPSHTLAKRVACSTASEDFMVVGPRKLSGGPMHCSLVTQRGADGEDVSTILAEPHTKSPTLMPWGACPLEGT